MAESAGEKTEMPTPKKLRDARNKGQVCSSKDIVSTALLIVGFCLCAVLGIMLVDDFSNLMTYIATIINEPSLMAPREVGKLALIIICKHSFIFVVSAAVVAIFANTTQVGFLFTFEPIKPNMSKLNIVEGFKRIFAKRNLFEFLK
jgi:type III secretion protein U